MQLIRAAKRVVAARGLTWKQITRATPQSRFDLVSKVRVVSLKFGMSNKLRVPKAIARTYSIERKGFKVVGVQYATSIEFHPNQKVKVSCSCEDFLYRWEYALTLRDASYITYSNGEDAVKTNPQHITGCCKHVLAVHAELISRKLIDF